MNAIFENPGGNYLSSGDAPLPGVYLLASIIFFGTFGYWIRIMRQNKKHVDIHIYMHFLGVWS